MPIIQPKIHTKITVWFRQHAFQLVYPGTIKHFQDDLRVNEAVYDIHGVFHLINPEALEYATFREFDANTESQE